MHTIKFDAAWELFGCPKKIFKIHFSFFFQPPHGHHFFSVGITGNKTGKMLYNPMATEEKQEHLVVSES